MRGENIKFWEIYMSVLRGARMTLFSRSGDYKSHQVRIVLAEKGVNFTHVEVDPNNMPEELLEINPYANVPTLVDRDLVLYDAQVIMEYLDERFPHPPLLPVYPVARAKSRLMVHRIETDWYSLIDKIEGDDFAAAQEARCQLAEGLTSIAPLCQDFPYFLSEEFTLVDCCIAPLLWRLEDLGVQITPEMKPLEEYAERIFERESYQASLTESERELHETEDVF